MDDRNADFLQDMDAFDARRRFDVQSMPSAAADVATPEEAAMQAVQAWVRPQGVIHTYTMPDGSEVVTSTALAQTDPTTAVCEEIGHERARQDARWGGAGHDDHHDLYTWFSLMQTRGQMAYDAALASGEETDPLVRRRLVQLAALVVATVEWLDRQELGS